MPSNKYYCDCLKYCKTLLELTLVSPKRSSDSSAYLVTLSSSFLSLTTTTTMHALARGGISRPSPLQMAERLPTPAYSSPSTPLLSEISEFQFNSMEQAADAFHYGIPVSFLINLVLITNQLPGADEVAQLHKRIRELEDQLLASKTKSTTQE